MKTQRPVNLDITAISLPTPAKASILHRISGIVLLPGGAFLLWLLDLSLRSEQGFAQARIVLDVWFWKLFLSATLVALIYHFCAGVRHLCMDLGWGESLEAGQRSAWLVFVFTILLSLFAGWRLWL